MEASQIASFIMDHRASLREFNLEDIVLRTGSWDDPLAPLARLSGSEKLKDKQKHQSTSTCPSYSAHLESVSSNDSEYSVRCDRKTGFAASQLSQDAGALEGLGEARSYEAAAAVIGV